MPDLRSKTSTFGRRMAAARALWRATGMGDDDMAAEMALDEAMNEFLNVGMLAVKKLLGAEHESEVVTKIGELLEA